VAHVKRCVSGEQNSVLSATQQPELGHDIRIVLVVPEVAREERDDLRGVERDILPLFGQAYDGVGGGRHLVDGRAWKALAKDGDDFLAIDHSRATLDDADTEPTTERSAAPMALDLSRKEVS